MKGKAQEERTGVRTKSRSQEKEEMKGKKKYRDLKKTQRDQGAETRGERCSHPQASLSISLDYTLLPLKIRVHTLVYTAWMSASFSPPKLVTLGSVLSAFPESTHEKKITGFTSTHVK